MIKEKRLKPSNTTINLNARSMKHFYEKLIYSTFLALGSTCIQAQTTTENFIKTQECLDATCVTKKETVVYFDGLGREKQALQVAGSPTGKTIVTQIEYDGFGRQAKENLPFPITAATNKIVSAATNGNTFYSTLTGDTTPFSEKTFENSPLNRVLAQAAPGNSWKKGANEIKFDYATNTDADKVQKFGVTLSAAFVPTLTLSGNYTAGTLYKTITTDENKQPIQEFKDKEGKIILKRINIPAITGTTNSSGNHDTYYVYDIYGNLTYVIPPKLVEVGTTVLANYTANLAELGYQYQYDDKNRLVEKQLPGKGREFMVYDKLDRLVATRDSQNEWIFTKYDKFNRIVYTGTLPTSARATLQSAYNTATIYHETRGTSGGLANNGITNGLYTNVAYPTSFTKITTINYYDEYTNLGVTPSSIDGQSVIGVTDTKTKGLAVASFTNVLGTTTWAKNYTYYDAKYIRPVATASTNYLGGYTNTASSLDFRGKPLKTITKHKQLAASTELTLTDEFVYYPNELLKSQTHQINSGAKEYIVQNSYNEINQLTIKKVGNSVATTPLQTIDYKYNIRGWMTDINNVDVTETTTYKDLFAFSIYYDNPHPGYGFRPGKYNGNISQTRWKSSTDNIIRNYVYEYDNLNRLTGSFYVKGDYLVGDVYNEYANYDKNGNILNMYRSGNQDLSSNMIWIDDLTYSYKLNSNKLLAVTDASTLKDGFNDGNKTGDDYTYDTNGNLTVDKNKGITKISYNSLNLPTEVLWNASKKINYTYDASGVKLRKVVTDGATVTTTDYLGGFQYQNNVLQFFPTTEGYVNVTNGTAFNYVYNYTDHLGNVRLSYQKNTDGTLKVLEENNYYPFGLKHSGYNNTNLANANYKYKYQGQELQDELGLGWYSFKYRNYDPAIGRFFNVDPLSEKYAYQSHYNFAENKLGSGRELEGLELGPMLGIFYSEATLTLGTAQTGYYASAGSSFSTTMTATSAGLTSASGTVGASISTTGIPLDQTIQLQEATISSSSKGGFWSDIWNGIKSGVESIGRVFNNDSNTASETTNTESSKTDTGRGSNNRTASDEAEGDHSVINERGNTTYRVNQNNPNKNSKGKGFETEKRVDYQGNSHKNKNGESIPTPHVQEKGNVRPAIPGEDMPKNLN